MKVSVTQTDRIGMRLDFAPGVMGPPGPSSTRTVDAGFFGFVGDGATDNSAAWNAFKVWAQTQSAAGYSVVLRFAAGTYKFDASLCEYALTNIKRLLIEGPATFQNTYDRNLRGGSFRYEQAWLLSVAIDLHEAFGGKINSVAAGATDVTLKTLSDHSKFAVGTYVLIASLDVQGYGYPPNCQRFDFRKITAKNTGTGVITLERGLTYEHRDDFPDLDNPDAKCGVARIWPLVMAAGSPFGPAGLDWDLEHEYRDLTFLPAPNTTIPYQTIGGRSMRFVTCRMQGISPSIAETVEIIGGEIGDVTEPDKLVGSLVLDGVHLKNQVAFQSSSIDRVVIRNCRGAGVQGGPTKSLLIDSSDIEFFSEGVSGQPYGLGGDQTIINSLVRGWGSDTTPVSTSGLVAVNGSTVTFSNGVIRVTKSSNIQRQCGALQPGNIVNIQATNGGGAGYSGDIGNGIVTRVYEDATYVYYVTSLPYTSLPSWASGAIYVPYQRSLRVINSRGCDAVRRAAEADVHGRRPYEYYRDILSGAFSSAGLWPKRYGILKALRVNVIAPAPSGTLEIYGPVQTRSTLAAITGDGNFYAGFDWTVQGERTLDFTGWQNKQTGDYLQWPSGTTKTALSRDLWFGQGLRWFTRTWNPSTSGLSPYQLPVVEVEMELEVGLLRRGIPGLLDNNGNTGTVITGDLP